jgi:hypothetical protein
VWVGIQVPPATKWVRQAAALIETRPWWSRVMPQRKPWSDAICRCNEINEIPRATPSFLARSDPSLRYPRACHGLRCGIILPESRVWARSWLHVSVSSPALSY